jgi:hypothetical protein
LLGWLLILTCVILQPSYIPWRGYFHQIQKADVFVFYDDVQYDHHGWRNRNRIKTAAGPKWLTIPLQSSGEEWRDSTILEKRISLDERWQKKHFETLRHSYSKTPYFSLYQPMLERWYGASPEKLADFTIATTLDVAKALQIEGTRFLRSSDLPGAGAKTERLSNILKQVGATRYVSGPAAREYLDVDLLQSMGIEVEWMSYEYPEYPQLYSPFDGKVSVLDLLFQTGDKAKQYIWATKK